MDFSCDLISELQQTLLGLTMDNHKDVFAKIMASPFILTEEGQHIILHNLLLSYKYRRRFPIPSVRIIGLLHKEAEKNEKMKNIPQIFIFLLSKEVLQRYNFQKSFISSYLFLREVVEQDIISLEILLSMLDDLFFTTYKKSRNWYSGESMNTLFIICFLSIFGHLLKDRLPQEYEKLENKITNDPLCTNSSTGESQFYREFLIIRQQNFNFFKMDPFQNGSIIMALHRDNLQCLQEIAETGKFDPNFRINPTILESVDELNTHPPLISIAAYYGCIKCFKFMVMNGADLKLKSDNGWDVLTYAIAGGNLEIIRNILNIYSNNQPPKHLISVAIQYHHFDIFYWFFTLYFNNLTKEEFIKEAIPMLCAASISDNVRVLDFLLTQGAIPGVVDSVGWTPLMYAAEIGNTEIAHVLLQRGDVLINNQDEKGWTALHRCAIHGHTRVLKLLLSHPTIDVNICNNSNRNALIRAARDGHNEALQLLLQFPGIQKNDVDKKSRSGLHYAVLLHHKSCVETLLNDPEVDPQMPDDSSYTPLHIAASNNFADLISLFANREGINLNIVDSIMWTPLHVAANTGAYEFVVELLKYKSVNINALNLMKRTPIFNAIENEHVEVVKALLAREDIDLTIVDSEGHTAKDLAIQTKNQEIINLL